MKKLRHYLISSATSPFASGQKNHSICVVPKIETQALDILADLSLCFNVEKAKLFLKRNPTLTEIATTLSHIKCWKAILANSEIEDSEFVLITEPTIEISDTYYEELNKHIERQLKNSKYNLFLLQRMDNDSFWNEKVYTENEEIFTIIFHQAYSYNNVGSSAYLIRKSLIKSILENLKNEKPFWRIGDFSEICDFNFIAQANLLLKDKQKYAFEYANQSPLFSIIVPVYNVEEYLDEAIRSVLQQNFQRYELILVNDGSKDNSAEVCLKYAKQYPNIIYIQKSNQGLAATRNLAMKIAKGDYLMFLDGDDYWEGREVLSGFAQVIAEKNNPDLIISHVTSLYLDRRVSHLLSIDDLGNDFRQDFLALLKRGHWQGYAFIKTIKRSIIQDNQLYFPEGRIFEDIMWSFELAQHIKTYAHFQSDFYMYRRERPGAITSFVTPKGVEDLMFVFEKCFEQFSQMNDKDSAFYAGVEEAVFRQIGFIKHCYELLWEHDKERLKEQYESILAREKIA
ncbi:glycosyltransferase [Actinobacillus porcinus]|uniref:glycosyltransferase n=1 Tax=Actinobacillus porcinus TaxID=51048 RepID=UPI002A9179EE|nr:glycosyltransferase [Actinobacillus porcinus]MDY6216304.1 glycosyltransferase [Actinobacillus porcinus]